MANKSAIRFLLLGLPILTAFSLPAGHRSDTAVLSAGLPSDAPAMIMQAFPNDFGDAPASYGSADHVMDGRRYLGGEPDGEASHQYSDEANGDDLTGRDDEDGVTIPELVQGKKATIRYQVVTPYATVYLNAWIDWNGDGDFNDNDERIASNVGRTFPGTYNLDITVPADATGSKPTFARFRLGARINTPTGTATSGEVEDYMIKIVCDGPEPPKVGRITQPSCETPTGSVLLEGLPGTGTWALTRLPDGETITGSGSSFTVTGLEPGTWSYTVTNFSGCTSGPSAQAEITAPPELPTAPVISTTVQPSCILSTGSVSLSGLPAEGTWTVHLLPGTRSFNGSGTTLTIDNIGAGTWYFTVTNLSGCTSAPSDNVVINDPPVIPSPPVPGTVTHPSCSSPTGTVELSGLP
ncbi:MAG: GEVED domain-containing protein, partial [Bacteroidales bacterium]|nr:GEVED domain-containing protein [Bacteroidales bacterium]